MFQTPYDRKSILISEIESFIARLEVKSVLREDLVFVEGVSEIGSPGEVSLLDVD